MAPYTMTIDRPGYRQKVNLTITFAFAERAYLDAAARRSNMNIQNYIREQLGLRLVLPRVNNPDVLEADGGEDGESYYEYLVALLADAGYPDPRAILGCPETERKQRKERISKYRKPRPPSMRKIEAYEYEKRMWDGGLRKGQPEPVDPRALYVNELIERDLVIPLEYRPYVRAAKKLAERMKEEENGTE